MKLTANKMNANVSLQGTFAALHHYNYRTWFMGQLVSLVGTWMQTTAQGYLVYELTHSAAYLGYVGFAAGLPSWLFTLFGGVVADRISRRTLLLVTQSVMMVLAFTLAWLVYSAQIQPWHIVGLAFLLGIANAFDAPARQAFVVELVERQDLTNAIALNSTMFNLAAVVGPSVAGITYAALGPAWCFTLNGLSFLAVMVALLLIRVQPRPREQVRQSALEQLRQGFRYVAATRLTLMLILNMGVVALFGISIVTLLPAWSVKILHGDVTTNGLLLSARGAGALIGALMVATLGRPGVKGKLWTAGSFCMPLMLVSFALVRWLPVSILFLAAVGWSFMIQANTSNSMVQEAVPDDLRGRVMSIYMLTFFGGMPLGALWAGKMATYLSEPLIVMINSVILLAVAVLIWVRVPSLRRR